jgi:hypothetical protein
MAYVAVNKDYSSKVGQCPGTLIGPQRRNTWTLSRFWRLILWNSLSGEFISIPKEVIGMETACEDKS